VGQGGERCERADRRPVCPRPPGGRRAAREQLAASLICCGSHGIGSGGASAADGRRLPPPPSLCIPHPPFEQVFKDVEIDTEQPPAVFKMQLFSLTGVPPERQKIMGVKGGLLKVCVLRSAVSTAAVAGRRSPLCSPLSARGCAGVACTATSTHIAFFSETCALYLAG